MAKKKNLRIDKARQSLEEMLHQIEPYLPKPQPVEEKPKKGWEIVGNGTVPPINSLGHQ